MQNEDLDQGYVTRPARATTSAEVQNEALRAMILVLAQLAVSDAIDAAEDGIDAALG